MYTKIIIIIISLLLIVLTGIYIYTTKRRARDKACQLPFLIPSSHQHCTYIYVYIHALEPSTILVFEAYFYLEKPIRIVRATLWLYIRMDAIMSSDSIYLLKSHREFCNRLRPIYSEFFFSQFNGPFVYNNLYIIYFQIEFNIFVVDRSILEMPSVSL